MTDGTKWAPGPTYGPVLSQTDLFLLHPKLELHPILTHSLKSFHLVFDLVEGRATGYNAESTDRDLPFEAKDEVATLPRVTELYVITRASPWCSIVKNPNGVTLQDIIGTIWRDYKQPILEEEFTSLPPVMQDRVKRTAANRGMGYQPISPWNAEIPHQRCIRVDWLRDKRFFDGMEHDDAFAKERLGFAAPNVLVMSLIS
ncbi:hypothetical protein PNOK_0329900 [Pyrrhoderma noxium]|uniref:DUF6699 domain-containing protein n=1 Tax=Pyrrhoderma noxium TaxID=2282107 RepID=A0A286UM82_9AGAM|nr:hypothetical protein PNOK_0329900 [Pyrrhoderma noxium]